MCLSRTLNTWPSSVCLPVAELRDTFKLSWVSLSCTTKFYARFCLEFVLKVLTSSLEIAAKVYADISKALQLQTLNRRFLLLMSHQS